MAVLLKNSGCQYITITFGKISQEIDAFVLCLHIKEKKVKWTLHVNGRGHIRIAEIVNHAGEDW